MGNMVREFKEFISRGNVIDLAVAVVLGAAFTGVVNAFANGILLALVAAVFGEPNFNELTLSLGDGKILYGTFITALVNFVIVAFAMFLVVKAVNRLQRLRRAQEEAEAAAVELTEIDLLTQIRDALTRGDRT